MSIIQGEPQLPVAAPSLPQPSVAPSVPIGSHFLPVGQPLPTSIVPQFSVSQLPVAAPHVSVAQPGFQSLPISMAGSMNQPLLTLATSAAATAVPVGSTVVPSQLPTLMQPVAQLPSQVLPQLLQPAVQSMGLPVSIGQAADASLRAWADSLLIREPLSHGNEFCFVIKALFKEGGEKVSSTHPVIFFHIWQWSLSKTTNIVQDFGQLLCKGG